MLLITHLLVDEENLSERLNPKTTIAVQLLKYKLGTHTLLDDPDSIFLRFTILKFALMIVCYIIYRLFDVI